MGRERMWILKTVLERFTLKPAPNATRCHPYLICTKFCANETEKINKYIRRLPDNIYGNVKSSKPKTLDETIELANDLMDQKLSTYAEKSDNKRKADDSSRNNHGHQQQPFKKYNVAKVYNIGTGEKKPYGGNLSKCTKCHFTPPWPVHQKFYKCNTHPKVNIDYECGAPGSFQENCLKLKNKDVGNLRFTGLGLLQSGIAEMRGECSGTRLQCRHGYIPLKQPRCIYPYSDIGADRSL
ncbi:hypothetical protein Tco_0168546 [Tanacetum coccineum]